MINLYQGDCLELLRSVPDNSVDLTVTSPPYDNLRTYNGNIAQWSFEKFRAIAKELYRTTVSGGVVVWIVNDATINGSETGTSFRQALYFKECGFNLHDTMIWKKLLFNQNPVRYAQDFEYMFVLSKGKPKTTNIICDKPNKSAARKVGYTKRKTDGTTEPTSAAKVGRLVKPYGQRPNIWDIPPCMSNTERTGHPAQFPEQLAHDHIVSWSNPGDTVLDPFMGSGTTGVACVNTGRNFIGMELDADYFAMAKRRISEASAQCRIANI